MKKILAILALMLAIPASILYLQPATAQGGGYPSRPTFQSVAIQPGAFKNPGFKSTCQYISIGSTPPAYILTGGSNCGSNDISLLDNLYYGSDGNWHYASSAAGFMLRLSGGNSLLIDSAPIGTAGATATLTQVPLSPIFAYGFINTTTGGCTVLNSGSTYVSSNLASCTRNSTGNYHVVFATSSTIGDGPICSFTAEASSPSGTYSIWHSGSATGVNLSVYLGGTLADGLSVEMICVSPS